MLLKMQLVASLFVHDLEFWLNVDFLCTTVNVFNIPKSISNFAAKVDCLRHEAHLAEIVLSEGAACSGGQVTIVNSKLTIHGLLRPSGFYPHGYQVTYLKR